MNSRIVLVAAALMTLCSAVRAQEAGPSDGDVLRTVVIKGMLALGLPSDVVDEQIALYESRGAEGNRTDTAIFDYLFAGSWSEQFMAGAVDWELRLSDELRTQGYVDEYHITGETARGLRVFVAMNRPLPENHRVSIVDASGATIATNPESRVMELNDSETSRRAWGYVFSVDGERMVDVASVSIASTME